MQSIKKKRILLCYIVLYPVYLLTVRRVEVHVMTMTRVALRVVPVDAMKVYEGVEV